MSLHTVIFVGRSGAGKGTQSELLKTYLAATTPDTPILYIETGAYFRKYIKESGDTWDRARKVMEAGARQPDFLAVWMWTTAFIEEYRGGQHLVFDGAPRALAEAKILETVFPFYGAARPTVVFLDVSQAWAEERLRGRGRADDLDPEVVGRRQAYFASDVLPVVDFYRTSPAVRFVEIHGERTPEEVHADIVHALGR